MLWLCLHFPLLPLSALGLEATHAAVVDQHGSQRWLITGTPDCEAGLSFTQATMLHPELPLKPRRCEAEQQLLQSLAHWAYRFGQPIAAEIDDLQEPGRLPRALLWIEIGSSLRLFGGIEPLIAKVVSELMELGHAAQIGIAPTRAAAALRACQGLMAAISTTDALEASLSSTPISALHWPTKILNALTGVGFSTLADLTKVPRDAFSKRFGTDYRLRLDRLLGIAADPFDAIVPPETFHRRLELGAEIENTGQLQFPLRRLCLELQGYLRSRDVGLRSIVLHVAHAGARSTRLHAQFVDPHRDGLRLFNALKERLDRDGLPMAARELTLLAEDFDEPELPQSDLFDNRAVQQQAWHAAIERIRGRLGDDKTWVPHLWPDHRPEQATARRPPPWPSSPPSSGEQRPSLLLHQPWPMPEPRLPPKLRFERIESGWWHEQDAQRDYTTLNINGGRAWVYRERKTGKWFLQGWWG